jgi:hypothetical protein
VFIALLWLKYSFFWHMTPRQWKICFRRFGTIILSQNFANKRIPTYHFNGHYDKKMKKQAHCLTQFLSIDLLPQKGFLWFKTRG